MTKELIDRAEALAAVACWDWQELYLPVHFKDAIEGVPTVEARTRSRWKRTDTGTTCEACGGAALLDDDGMTVRSRFCPHCGALMDGGGV